MRYSFVELATFMWSLWGLSWLIAAVWAGRTVSGADRSSYRGQLGVAFAGFLCLFIQPPLRNPAAGPIGPLLGWSMIALVAAGFAFAWWARLHLGALWSGGIVRREGHRIVESGPYGLVRHPIYTGIIMGAIGLTVLKATWLCALGTLLITLGFGLKARVEERFLGAELGEADYARYRRRVPMLVPFTKALRRPA